jgi:UDP-N-acetyl-D-galactosamine dehydrogenase
MMEKVATMYESIVKPGVYRCTSIKAAEACKVIENTQRDLNIALMNELAIIFDKIGIDSAEVLRASSTKWNFLKFSTGLVGGHKDEMLGYHPKVILAGWRINDGSYVKGARVNVLGLTFKETAPTCATPKWPTSSTS